MNRWMRWTLAALLTWFALAAWATAGLRENIERAVRTTDLGGAAVGVSVREAGPGTAVAEIDAEQLMIPASNMKLLTTGAALHTLGEGFRFQTQLVLEGERLIVVGDGEGVAVIPAALADEIAEETFEMTVYEDFVQDMVEDGWSTFGLYPMTEERARRAFEAWRKKQGR